MGKVVLMCIHCRWRRQNRARALCGHCYGVEEIKALYPPASKFGRRGIGLKVKGWRRPAEPTEAPAGSEEKIQVMMERAERGETMDHPGDSLRIDPTIQPTRLATDQMRQSGVEGKRVHRLLGLVSLFQNE